MSPFTNKNLMITGGTGSFGNAVLNRFLNTDISEIRIFSRDEKKQDDMRHEFQAKMPEAAEKISFYIGDVRDLQSVKNAMHGVDYIFHAAALKHTLAGLTVFFLDQRRITRPVILTAPNSPTIPRWRCVWRMRYWNVKARSIRI